MTRFLLLCNDKVNQFDVSDFSFQDQTFSEENIFFNPYDFFLQLSKGFGNLTILDSWTIHQFRELFNFWTNNSTSNIPKFSTLVSTSATTGLPKLCLYTSTALKAISHAPYRNDFLNHTIYSSLSLAHSYIYPGSILPAINTSNLFVVDREKKPLSFVEKFNYYKPSFLITVPAQLRFWIKFKKTFHFVHQIYSAGGPFPAEIYEDIRICFPNANLINNYGATECGPRLGRKLLESVEDVGHFDNLEDQLLNIDSNKCFATSPRLMFNYLGSSTPINSFELQDQIILNNSSSFKIVGRNDSVINLGGKKISKESLSIYMNMYFPGHKYGIDSINSRIYIISEKATDTQTNLKLLAESLLIEPGYIVFYDNPPPTISK